MRNPFLSAMALCALWGFLAQESLAQEADPGQIERRIEQLRPTPLPKAQPKLQEPTAAPLVETGDEISFVLAAVSIQGASVFDAAEFGSLYAEFLAREVGPADLAEIALRITAKYNTAGYFLSHAVVPPQEVQGGVLRVRVVEGYLSEVRFRGDSAQDGLLGEYRGDFTRERPARLSTVERGLLVINDLPGMAVGDVQVAKVDDDGAYALVIPTTHSAVSGGANLDNRGTPEVGRLQGWTSVAFNSVMGLGERVQVSIATVPDQTSELVYGQLGYEQPLGTGGAVLGVSLAASAIDAGKGLAQEETESRSYTAKTELRHPILLSRRQAMNLQVSFEVRGVSEDRFAISTIDDRLSVARVQVDYSLQDDLGGTSYAALEVSQGLDILNASNAGDINLSRPDGEGSFTKFRLDIIRLQKIWGPVSLRLGGQAQASLDPLLSSEEFLIGGSQFGRGYDFGEISGENGVAGSAELRFGQDRDSEVVTSYEAYGFVDGGALRNRNTASGSRSQTLASAGGGLRIGVSGNALASFEVAKPLDRRVDTTGDRDLRFFFAISAQF